MEGEVHFLNGKEKRQMDEALGIIVLVLIQSLAVLALPPPNFKHYFILSQGSKSIQLAKSVLEQGYNLPTC